MTILECCFDRLLGEDFLISLSAPLLLRWIKLCLVSVMTLLNHFLTTFQNSFFRTFVVAWKIFGSTGRCNLDKSPTFHDKSALLGFELIIAVIIPLSLVHKEV